MKLKNKLFLLKRIILLFIVYSFLFITIFMFLDYYDFYEINPLFLIRVSIIIGAVTTFVHIKSRTKSRIDDIIDKL